MESHTVYPFTHLMDIGDVSTSWPLLNRAAMDVHVQVLLEHLIQFFWVHT